MRFRWATCTIVHMDAVPVPADPQERELEQARQAWSYVLGDVRGRRALRRILSWSRVLPGEVANDFGSVEQLNHEAGQRSVGSRLVEQILAFAPEAWALMEKERAEDSDLARRVAASQELGPESHA